MGRAECRFGYGQDKVAPWYKGGTLFSVRPHV